MAVVPGYLKGGASSPYAQVMNGFLPPAAGKGPTMMKGFFGQPPSAPPPPPPPLGGAPGIYPQPQPLANGFANTVGHNYVDQYLQAGTGYEHSGGTKGLQYSPAAHLLFSDQGKGDQHISVVGTHGHYSTVNGSPIPMRRKLPSRGHPSSIQGIAKVSLKVVQIQVP